MRIDSLHELSVALRRTGRFREAGTWFVTWPGTRIVAQRLASYIGNAVPYRDEVSLLEQCLRDAFDSVRNLGTAPEEERRFLASLLWRTPHMLRVRIGLRLGQDVLSWDPLLESLETFLAQQDERGTIEIYPESYCELPDDQARLLIAVRILSVADIERIGINRLTQNDFHSTEAKTG